MTIPDRDSLIKGLVTIGREAVVKSNDELFYDYFTEDYVLHSPAGEFNREEIRSYFAALRESFTGYRIDRRKSSSTATSSSRAQRWPAVLTRSSPTRRSARSRRTANKCNGR